MLRFELFKNDIISINLSRKDSVFQRLLKQLVIGTPEFYLSILVFYSAPNVASAFVLLGAGE